VFAQIGWQGDPGGLEDAADLAGDAADFAQVSSPDHLSEEVDANVPVSLRDDG
jgi:hypothetical protein